MRNNRYGYGAQIFGVITHEREQQREAAVCSVARDAATNVDRKVCRYEVTVWHTRRGTRGNRFTVICRRRHVEAPPVTLLRQHVNIRAMATPIYYATTTQEMRERNGHAAMTLYTVVTIAVVYTLIVMRGKHDRHTNVMNTLLKKSRQRLNGVWHIQSRM